MTNEFRQATSSWDDEGVSQPGVKHFYHDPVTEKLIPMDDRHMKVKQLK